jgi:hypothetical protein
MRRKVNAIILVIVLLIFGALIFYSCKGPELVEIKDPNTQALEDAIRKGEPNNFDYGTYQILTKGRDKTIKITLEFKTDDIFRVGTVTAIRNLVLENLENKYSENLIDLTIASEKPVSTVEYKYKNGKWDKDVN